MSLREPIAIVGIGARFPGAASLGQFWSLVEAGRSSAREVRPGRWALDPGLALGGSRGSPDRVASAGACSIEERVPGSEALDPMIRLLLQAGTEAWLDAKTGGVDRARVGVILGNIALPTESTSRLADWVLGRRFEKELFEQAGVARPPETRRPIHEINRWVTGLPAGLLARSLRLGGGHCTLDAACASSLFALKLAVDELQAHRADAMLAGGLSRPDSLYTQMGFSRLGALSPSGRCSPFDERGDGLVVGEGAGVLLLRRLTDAVSAGDHVYAVIRGIGLSNDVEGNLLAPSQEGQLRAMRAAYLQAGWSPWDVDLIECHATGTPIGDATEYGSLRKLWGETGWTRGQCVIGAVKSNVGHLLTGAGAAGLIKVLLALKNRVLPPTANFGRPARGIDLGSGPFRVLAQAEDWPGSAVRPRRAAVSGFGFGGTNAHVLIEEFVLQGAASHSPGASALEPRFGGRESPISIVGMDAAVGPWTGLAEFQRRVLGGGAAVEPAAKRNYWGLEDPPRGWFIENLEIPVGEFRIPPKEIEECLPQQILMLQVAKRALTDAGIPEWDRLRTGVFVGIGLDLSTTNYHLRWTIRQRGADWARELGLNLEGEALESWIAEQCDRAHPALNANRTMGALGGIVASRIAREFGIGGPSFVVSSEEGSGVSALEAAVRALQAGELDCAVVGAVDFPGDPRTILTTDLLQPFARSGVARPFDRRAEGTVPGEGAAAVVLLREADALRLGCRAYAAIRGVGSASGGTAEATEPDAQAYLAALERAYSDAGLDPASVGYLEAHGSGLPAEDRVEAEALARFFAGAKSAALGSVKSDVGHTGAASALVSVVKASLCLYQEIVPALRGLEQPRPGLDSFVRPKAARYWLHDRAEGHRRAGVSAMSVSGYCGHVVLEACPGLAREAERRRPLGAWREALFAVEAQDEPGLLRGLEQLRSMAGAGGGSIEGLARAWWSLTGRRPEAARGLALIARDAEELAHLIGMAREGLGGGRLTSASGGRIFYSAEPLGREAEVAFVFPGSGSQYPGMGRDFSAQWPEVLREQEKHSLHLRAQLMPELAWDVAGKRGEMEARELILAQVALGTVVSDLLRGFVRPSAAIGYSLGETAGLFSMGAWRDRDEMLRRVMQSPLFVSELTGPCDAARRVWGLPPGSEVRWSLGVVDRPAPEVREALRGVGRAYLLIVNTPDECVIGGQAEAVREVVEKLDSQFVPLHGVTTVHCEVARQVEAAYRELHLLPTSAPEDVRFYSGAWGRAYAVDRESAAESIVAQALEGIDFPRVVRRAWEDGVRVFIEVGPGRSCTRMISKILRGERFAADAVCVEGQDAVGSVLRVLGMLVAERVEVRLENLYAATLEQTEKPSGKAVSLKVGGSAFKKFENKIRSAGQGTQSLAGAGQSPAAAEATPAEKTGSARTRQRADGPLDTPSGVPRRNTPFMGAGAAHAAFLELASRVSSLASRQAEFQMRLLGGSRPALDRKQCLEFAVGSIASVLGPDFAPIDKHPTRVRLPDEPLMLVDRILEIQGEPRSMGSGRVVTEHDVLAGAWYLDAGRIPTCIAVEAGQADLFLSGYLGIDFLTRGLAVYRLLDATVTFQAELPRPGQTIRYSIEIERFFQQGEVWLFRFRFDATVAGRPLLTMRDGCAGFFTQADLDAGKGILKSRLDQRPQAGVLPADWRELAPMQAQALDEAQVEALRLGNLAAAFGEAFARPGLPRAPMLPGGRMRLVHRVPQLSPRGGRYGLGLIVAEADVHPDDWFITCHFVDDRVMPGTLMYECCLHTLRIFLLRLGWVGAEAYEPVPGVKSRLKCRGQVLESTKVITYEITIKELGYRPEPYAIADALMYSDGKPIVEIGDMSLRLSGLDRDSLESLWREAPQKTHRGPGDGVSWRGEGAEPLLEWAPPTPAKGPGGPLDSPVLDWKPALYDYARILAFSSGRPSEAFGEPYRVFDEERRIARLPRPPFQFLDRITAVSGEPFKMAAGASCEAQVEVRRDEWYFASNRQSRMPFSVLLEIALQPCGWLAAYVGSALTSPTDLKFRNLGGEAVLHAPVPQEPDLLTTTARLTNVSSSGGMIIQHYSFLVQGRRGRLYEGTTYFGFFSQQALAEQVGLRDARRFTPDPATPFRAFPVPAEPPFPEPRMRMVDRVDVYQPTGGPHGLGFIRGSIEVDPGFWFFDAHFYQDPVWPGSLGLEAFLQLLKVVAAERWGVGADTVFSTMPLQAKHAWVYRGQVIPGCRLVEVEASITSVDEARRRLVADGYLLVDGRPIYQMNRFALEIEA